MVAGAVIVNDGGKIIWRAATEAFKIVADSCCYPTGTSQDGLVC